MFKRFVIGNWSERPKEIAERLANEIHWKGDGIHSKGSLKKTYMRNQKKYIEIYGRRQYQGGFAIGCIVSIVVFAIISILS